MPRLAPTSRRTAIAVLLGAGLAGCSFGSLDPSDSDPTLTPTRGPGTGTDTAPEPDPDTALLAAAALAVSRTHRLVRTARRQHPGLADLLRPLERLHRVHARELGGLRPVTARPDAGGEDDDRARARVARAEDALVSTLVRGSTEAESGALALLLASIAAGVTQVRTTLGAS